MKRPAAWQELTIGELASPAPGSIAIGPFGSRMKADTYVAGRDSAIPVVRGSNLTPTKELAGDFVFVAESTADQLRSANVFPNDLIFPHRGLIGEVGIIPDGRTKRYVLSTSLMKLTCNVEVCDPLYLFYFFRSPAGRHELLKNASQVGTPGIATPLTSLKAIRVALPPLPEQRAIAHILGTLDDKIELNRRMNQTLEEIARALFHAWFVAFDPVRTKAAGCQPAGMDAATAALFPDAFEETEHGEIPAGWRCRPIGDVVRAVGGSTPRTAEAAYWDGTIGFCTPKDLSALPSPVLIETSRHITEAGAATISSGILPVGTVLMSSRAPIGYLAITSIETTVNQGMIAMISGGLLPNHYVYLWAQQNMDAIKGNANGTTFLEISKRNFRPIPVLVPNPSALGAFEGLVAPLFARIEANDRETQMLVSIRNALLPKLLSGEIRVGELDAMAAPAGGANASCLRPIRTATHPV